MAATPSRRALRVLALLPKHGAWRVEWAYFSRCSRVTLGGIPWKITRALKVNDAGIFAQIGTQPTTTVSPAKKRRLVSKAWPVLRDAVLSAGFELWCDFADENSFGLFGRRLESVEGVTGEWKFLQGFRPWVAMRGLHVPTRPGLPASDLSEEPGSAHRTFAALRRNRVLMSNLGMARIVRPIDEQIEGQPWKGTLAIMGDRDWLQAVVHFWPDTSSRELTERAREVVSCITGPLVERGYEDLQDGAFVLSPLGRVSTKRELAFLDGLSLSTLLALGKSPHHEQGRREQDRAFYDLLGPERATEPCKHPGCDRGAVALSVMCRVHHFEAIKERACPFDD